MRSWATPIELGCPQQSPTSTPTERERAQGPSPFSSTTRGQCLAARLALMLKASDPCLGVGDRPNEPGELACDSDGDDRLAFAALALEAAPDVV